MAPRSQRRVGSRAAESATKPTEQSVAMARRDDAVVEAAEVEDLANADSASGSPKLMDEKHIAAPPRSPSPVREDQIAATEGVGADQSTAAPAAEVTPRKKPQPTPTRGRVRSRRRLPTEAIEPPATKAVPSAPKSASTNEPESTLATTAKETTTVDVQKAEAGRLAPSPPATPIDSTWPEIPPEPLTPRRSARNRARIVDEEERAKKMIREGRDTEELLVVEMDAKGKGVLAGRAFRRGEYVCEYAGELIELEEAHRREERYRTEATAKGLDEMMCYMYFLRHKSRTYCVDATQTGRVGRLINHSRAKPNLKTKLFVLDDRPHLGFIVKRDIEKGEELLYDYGERDPATLRQMPWLKQ